MMLWTVPIEDLGPASEMLIKPAGKNSLDFSPGFNFLSSETQVRSCYFKSAWIWYLRTFHRRIFFLLLLLNLITKHKFIWRSTKPKKFIYKLCLTPKACTLLDLSLDWNWTERKIERKINILGVLAHCHAKATKNLLNVFIPRFECSSADLEGAAVWVSNTG